MVGSCTPAWRPTGRGLARWWPVALVDVIAVVVLASPVGAGAATAMSTWRLVTGPAVPNGELYAVAGLGPSDVWAVGDHLPASAAGKTLTERWDGAAW